MRRVPGIVLIVCTIAACAPATSPPPPTPAAAPRGLPSTIVWSRRSAEHRALFLQTYRLAGERLTELARQQARGSWAVILDADETILDNSIFEERRALTGEPYSEAKWEEYVREEIATALPGAVEFMRHVRVLGGRVAIVSNRGADVCAATRRNLTKLMLEADIVLCHPAPPASGDKNPRFRAVQDGTAAAGVPPLRVLMWVGDNIQDFPALTQDIRQLPDSAFRHFGRTYFLLPNPVYGSWEKNN
jgi:5'-nucleotidase (lipoprotein e(P4) family)